MKRIIDKKHCIEVGLLSKDEKNIDKSRVAFILKKKLRNVSGKKRLGLAWMVMDPVITSMIYLFVLTVLRGRTDPESLFIGIATYQVLQNSLKTGCISIRDLTGGFKAERVRTKTILLSSIRYRCIDTLATTSGVIGVLLLAYNISFAGIFFLIVTSQIIGLVFEGIGLSISLTIRRFPDLLNVINLFLRLMFFAGPVMYPMVATEGIHYKINLFNPFTYFVEFARYQANQESIILDLNPMVSVLILTLCLISAYFGYSRVDKFRWRMTTWA